MTVIGIWLVLLLFAFAPSAAQELRGRVVREGRGVPDVQVTLHRVTRDSSGVVAKSTSGPGGEFRFRPPPASDSGFTVLFATVEWQGVRYFGTPLHPTQPRERYEVAVFDTASAARLRDAVRLARRDLVLLPEEGNGWEVNEIIQVENGGERTLVSTDGRPTWEFSIPEEATGFEAGDAGLGMVDVRRMGNRVLLTTPLRPGTQELVVRYRIPRAVRRVAVPVGTATGELSVLVRQPAPEMEIRGLIGPRPEMLAGEAFQRYSATELQPGASVRIGWRDPSQAPVSPVLAASLVAGLLLAGGMGAAVRNARAIRPG